jgi:hypothetical protein
MLSQPEFKNLQWNSLQSNGFFPTVLWPSAEFIKNFRKTGSQGDQPLSMVLYADTPTAVVDPFEVGVLAAHLLAEEATGPHNNKRYMVNGPKDVTEKEIVQLV